MQPPFSTAAPFAAESLRREPPYAHPEESLRMEPPYVHPEDLPVESSRAPSRDEWHDTRSHEDPTAFEGPRPAVYEALGETPFRDYLINVQDKMVRRYGEDVMLLDSGRIETLEPRLVRSGPSGGFFRLRIVG